MRFTSIGRSVRVYPLAQVPLTENERHEAEHYLELGERMAELILRTAAAVSSALHAIERAARAFAGARSTH